MRLWRSALTDAVRVPYAGGGTHAAQPEDDYGDAAGNHGDSGDHRRQQEAEEGQDSPALGNVAPGVELLHKGRVVGA